MGEMVKKFLTFMGIGDVRDNEEEITPEKKEDFFAPEPKPRYTDISTASAPASQGRKGKVVNIHTTTQLKVVVLQPTTYNDATEITDHLREKKPVVVNLEKLDKDSARKIVDFLSGAVYALTGKMQKVANGIILLVPSTMGIAGDFSDDFSDELKTHALFDFF